MAIISFTKVDLPYGWLGNMSAFPILYNGKLWKTSEALFQALRFDDEYIKEEIRNQASPMSAKMKAKTYKYDLVVTPLSEEDIENMRLCLRLKFNQHPQLKKKLLITGNHLLIEDIGVRKGERHKFWGAYRNEKNEWIGENKLGKLLMELRSEFQAEEKDLTQESSS